MTTPPLETKLHMPRRRRELVPRSLEHGLLDELHLRMFPVIAGRGQRLLDDVALTHLKLVDSTRFGSGIVVLTLTP